MAVAWFVNLSTVETYLSLKKHYCLDWWSAELTRIVAIHLQLASRVDSISSVVLRTSTVEVGNSAA